MQKGRGHPDGLSSSMILGIWEEEFILGRKFAYEKKEEIINSGEQTPPCGLAGNTP